jgi:periplasmic divalent cation tolerance protein
MGVEASDFVVVMTTASSDTEAGLIARSLVERRLAACVTAIPGARSVYRWQDGIEEAEERVLLIKTTTSLVDAVGDAIHELHGYEVPELLVLPATGGSERYLAWLGASVRASSRA